MDSFFNIDREKKEEKGKENAPMESELFQRELERTLPERMIETLIFHATMKTLYQFSACTIFFFFFVRCGFAALFGAFIFLFFYFFYFFLFNSHTIRESFSSVVTLHNRDMQRFKTYICQTVAKRYANHDLEFAWEKALRVPYYVGTSTSSPTVNSLHNNIVASAERRANKQSFAREVVLVAFAWRSCDNLRQEAKRRVSEIIWISRPRSSRSQFRAGSSPRILIRRFKSGKQKRSDSLLRKRKGDDDVAQREK